MKYTSTYIHIRALATLLAFASVIIAPASASVQNAASQQPAATAAGSSKSSDNSNQTTKQPNPHSATRQEWEQFRFQFNSWSDKVYSPQNDKLYRSVIVCSQWQEMYDTVVAKALKEFGTAEEKKKAAVIANGVKKAKGQILTAWGKIERDQKNSDQRIIQRRAEASRDVQGKYARDRMKEGTADNNDLANKFNANSKTIYTGVQAMVDYHNQVTEIVDEMIDRLNKDGKQGAADELDNGWKRNPPLLKQTGPLQIPMFEFDPTKPIPPKATGQKKGGKAKATAQQQQQEE